MNFLDFGNASATIKYEQKCCNHDDIVIFQSVFLWTVYTASRLVVNSTKLSLIEWLNSTKLSEKFNEYNAKMTILKPCECQIPCVINYCISALWAIILYLVLCNNTVYRI